MNEPWSVRLEIGYIPPSINRAYIPRLRRGKGGVKLAKVMNNEVRAFVDRFKTDIVSRYLQELCDLPDDGVTVFRIDYKFVFDTLINKTWGEKGGAKHRYKIVDTSNRVIIIENALKAALDIDDSMFFVGEIRKEMDPGHVRTEITITAQDPEDFGVPPVGGGEEGSVQEGR